MSDIERGWILVNKEQHRQLKSLQEKGSKKEVSQARNTPSLPPKSDLRERRTGFSPLSPVIPIFNYRNPAEDSRTFSPKTRKTSC